MCGKSYRFVIIFILAQNKCGVKIQKTSATGVAAEESDLSHYIVTYPKYYFSEDANKNATYYHADMIIQPS